MKTVGTLSAHELLNESYEPVTPAQRVELLKRAADIADAENDLDLAFQIRTRLVHATFDVPGSIDQLTHFSWLVARHDEEPERFPLQLWYYKWVAGGLPQLPEISRHKVSSMIDDLERRFEKKGTSNAPALKLRMYAAMNFGEPDEVLRYRRLWQAELKKGWVWLNDCSTCDEAAVVSSLLFAGEDRRALAKARYLIDGTSSCAHQPQITLSRLIAPARRTGDNSSATSFRKRSFRVMRNDPVYFNTMHNFVRDSYLQGDHSRAFELIGKYLPWSEETDQTPRAQLDFAAAARLVILRRRHLGRPTADCLADPRLGGRSAEEVANVLVAQAEHLAERFDSRNGNNWFANILAADLEHACR